MYSIVWNFIDNNPFRLPKIFTYILLILGSVVFSLPRHKEVWFLYVLIVFPVIVIALLELMRRILPFLLRIKQNSQNLLEKQEDKNSLGAWWEDLNKREHLIWCIAIALFLASLSLAFNANNQWSRYTDAMGVFYVGFMVGEVGYLLLLVPTGISQLNRYPLKLNPVNPASTVYLQILAETTFSLAVGFGLSLLALNVIVGTASYLFPHLFFGVLLISLLAWGSVLSIAIYPHFILWGLSQKTKRKTLQMLEEKIFEQFEYIINDNKTTSSIEDSINLYNQIQSSNSFPISNSGLFGIATTLFLNILPVLIGYI